MILHHTMRYDSHRYISHPSNDDWIYMLLWYLSGDPDLGVLSEHIKLPDGWQKSLITNPGFYWRSWPGIADQQNPITDAVLPVIWKDQMQEVIDELKRNLESRRAVMTSWDPTHIWGGRHSLWRLPRERPNSTPNCVSMVFTGYHAPYLECHECGDYSAVDGPGMYTDTQLKHQIRCMRCDKMAEHHVHLLPSLDIETHHRYMTTSDMWHVAAMYTALTELIAIQIGAIRRYIVNHVARLEENGVPTERRSKLIVTGDWRALHRDNFYLEELR